MTAAALAMADQEKDATPWQKAEATFNAYALYIAKGAAMQALTYLTFSKRNSEYFDPCQEAASRSIKCIHRNAGDKSLCTDYFQQVMFLFIRNSETLCSSLYTNTLDIQGLQGL